MNKYSVRGLLLASLVLGLSQHAEAHVNYFDLTSAPGGTWNDVFSSYGWQQGTTTTLTTTDGVSWYSFNLSQASAINLSISETSPGVAPAFSLYNGLMVNDAFDVTAYDPLNPTSNGSPVQSITDNGVTTDINGNVSPLRDTVHIVYTGQVDTLHSFSLTTETDATGADFRVINYMLHVTDGGTGTASLLNYVLPAGDYTVLAGGNANLDASNQTQYSITGTFNTSPVPIPAAFWLMGSVLGLFGVFGRRK